MTSINNNDPTNVNTNDTKNDKKNINDSSKPSFDDYFSEIGEFGPYQLFIFLLVGFTSAIPSMTAYSELFTSATPEFR
jgi:hypothetical protein